MTTLKFLRHWGRRSPVSDDRTANAIAGPQRRLADIDWFVAFALLSASVGLGARLLQRSDTPLWLDETFTGAIAGEPTFTATLRQVFLDVNAPSYYLVAHFWTSLTSLSNDALRAPALLFGLIGPVVCLAGIPGLTSRGRWLWFSLAALWPPAIIYSNEARGYSLVFALSIANTIAFARIYARHTLGSALLWSTSVSALLLTHYTVVFFVFVQGIFLIVSCRTRLFRFWPAILPVVPALAFMAFHSKRVMEFADPQIAWYPLVHATDLVQITIWTLGGYGATAALIAFGAMLAWRRHRNIARLGEQVSSRADASWIAASAGVVGWGVFLILCMFRPNFSFRYLIVFAPPILLGLVLITENAAMVRRYIPGALLLLATAQTVPYLLADRKSFNLFEFETGSQFLMDAGVGHVTFLWDNPTNRIEAPEQMDLVADFFFKRAGYRTDVKAIRIPEGADPNDVLSAAASNAGAGFIWVYDPNVRLTAATRFPPRFDETKFACHDKLTGRAAVLSCMRRKDP